MKTRYRVISPNDMQRAQEALEIELVPPITTATFHALIDPIVGGDYEHVTVFCAFEPGGQEDYRDMFVSETGVLDQLPVNHLATGMYHRNVVVHDPDGLGSPESLAAAPRIHGVAVLFERVIWS
jgi:hypothetical protein